MVERQAGRVSWDQGLVGQGIAYRTHPLRAAVTAAREQPQEVMVLQASLAMGQIHSFVLLAQVGLVVPEGRR